MAEAVGQAPGGVKLEELRPVRPVTPEEIETFWKDGVVKLEGILPPQAAEFLTECFDDVFRQGPKVGGRMRNSSDLSLQAEELEQRGEQGRLLAEGGYHEGKQTRTGRFVSEIMCFKWHQGFRRFCTSSPLPEIIAQLLGTKRLKFYADHLFFKQQGSLLRTAFHQDSSYFSLEGEQVAACWIPCDIVTRESGAMGYVRGSHRWRDAEGKEGVVFQPKNLVTNQTTQIFKDKMPAGMPELPDIEANEKAYDVIYHEAKPGDVLVHHLHTIHGSGGNSSLERSRRAAAIRYIGDDVVFKANRAGTGLGFQAYAAPTKENPLASANLAALEGLDANSGYRGKDGDPLENDFYPLVWPRTGPLTTEGKAVGGDALGGAGVALTPKL